MIEGLSEELETADCESPVAAQPSLALNEPKRSFPSTSSWQSTVPFLRWAGGKRWLARKLHALIARRLTATGGRYIEAFLGSGALFYALAPKRALLNDLNAELMLAHATVSRCPKAVIKKLKSWPVSRENYLVVRAMETNDTFVRACRLIWLNRTCYGGLYRTNRAGEFNTPYGGGERRPDSLWEHGILIECSRVLHDEVVLSTGDFEDVVDQAKSGDVVFCDPTYSNHSRDHFDRYGSTVFSWSDQVRLAAACRRAKNRGATVMVTNGAYDEVASLYPDAYRIRHSRHVSLGRTRKMGSDEEYLFILDPDRRRRTWSGLGEIENRLRTYEHLTINSPAITMADIRRRNSLRCTAETERTTV